MIFIKIASMFLMYYFAQMAYNVPAVYDVLPARIRACGARPGLAKCAGVSRGKKRSD
jgi:hypothetical protein